MTTIACCGGVGPDRASYCPNCPHVVVAPPAFTAFREEWNPDAPHRPRLVIIGYYDVFDRDAAVDAYRSGATGVYRGGNPNDRVWNDRWPDAGPWGSMNLTPEEARRVSADGP